MKWISHLFRRAPEFECLKTLGRDGLHMHIEHGLCPHNRDMQGAKIFVHLPDGLVQIAAILQDDLPATIWLLTQAEEFLATVSASECAVTDD